MSGAVSRLKSLLDHLGGGQLTGPNHDNHHGARKSPAPAPSPAGWEHGHHIHQLSPTYFLERAAAIEPDAVAIHHVSSNGRELRRSYAEMADRARGLAYFLRSRGHRRVGILATNTPAFLESIFGIVAAGGVLVPANYRYVLRYVHLHVTRHLVYHYPFALFIPIPLFCPSELDLPFPLPLFIS